MSVSFFALALVGPALRVAIPRTCIDQGSTRAGATSSRVLASSRPSDWQSLSPNDVLYMDLPTGRVVIDLDPTYAPAHVANIRILAHQHYWDGLAVLRVQDDFVTEWGDPASKAQRPAKLPLSYLPARTLGHASATVPPEFTREISAHLPFTRLESRDVYAPEVGYSNGFQVGRDPATGQTWLLNCYGAVGVARGTAVDSGSGAELYAVIGQAPRQLDRNTAVVGRVVMGMKYLSELRRGNGPLGVYEVPAHRTRILRVRLASALPPAERLHLEVLRTHTRTFAAWIHAQRDRPNAWFHYKPGAVSICNAALPVRVVHH